MLLFFKGVDYFRTRTTTLAELPDPENQAQVTRFFMKVVEALEEEEWPEEMLQAAEFLLERAEANPEILEIYFKDCWLPSLKRAENELLTVFLEISCVDPRSKALQPAEDLTSFCLGLLRSEAEPHAKLSALKLLSVQPRSDSILSAVISCLHEPTDFIRTESLDFLKRAALEGEDIHKQLCSFGLVDELMLLLAQDEEYTVRESLGLLTLLMSSYSRQFIREVPGLPPALGRLIESFPEEVLSFIQAAVVDNHQVIPSNQIFFNSLLPSVSALALPVSVAQSPNVSAQAVLLSLITLNKVQLKKTLTLQLGPYDLVEVAACHALTSRDSRLFLAKLILENGEVQPAIINKITAMPGFEVSPGCIRPLNWLLQEALVTTEMCEELCQFLELVVFNNPLSKELAQSLPIDLKSSTLRSRLSDILIREVTTKNLQIVVPISRLMFVWMDSVLAAKLFDKIVSVLPLIVSLTEDVGSSGIVTAFLGSLVLQRPEEAYVFKGALTLHDWLKSLETLTRDKTLESLAMKSDLIGTSGVVSNCFAKVFTKEFPKLRKQLLGMYVEEAEQASQETIEETHFNKQLEAEVMTLQRKLTDCLIEIERLRTETASVRLESSGKVRGLMEALIEAEVKDEASREYIWRLERDISLMQQKSPGVSSPNPNDVYLEKRLSMAEDRNRELLELVGELSSVSPLSNKETIARHLEYETIQVEIKPRLNRKVLRLGQFVHTDLRPIPKAISSIGTQVEPSKSQAPPISHNKSKLEPTIRPKILAAPALASPFSESVTPAPALASSYSESAKSAPNIIPQFSESEASEKDLKLYSNEQAISTLNEATESASKSSYPRSNPFQLSSEHDNSSKPSQITKPDITLQDIPASLPDREKPILIDKQENIGNTKAVDESIKSANALSPPPIKIVTPSIQPSLKAQSIAANSAEHISKAPNSSLPKPRFNKPLANPFFSEDTHEDAFSFFDNLPSS